MPNSKPVAEKIGKIIYWPQKGGGYVMQVIHTTRYATMSYAKSEKDVISFAKNLGYKAILED